MSIFDQRTLIPADDNDNPMLMWTYASPDAEIVGMGKMGVLVETMEGAHYYGDGEDHSVSKVWVITAHGPVSTILRTTAQRDGSIRVSVKWLARTPGTPGSEVMEIRAWYTVKDF